MGELRLLATGDSIITRRVLRDPDPHVQDLIARAKSADASFTNLEMMTPKRPWVPSSEYGGMHLSAPPWVLDELRGFGFNLFNVANNHATDYTYQGLLDTLLELKAREMVYAGGGWTLGEARAPAYLETGAGRVALIAAASSYVTGAHAAEARADVGGRPGVNPLRFDTRFELDAERLAKLEEIDEALGTAAVTRRNEAFGIGPGKPEGAHRILRLNFFEGEEPAVRTECNKGDLEAICGRVQDARRQADIVVVSLHAHEGQDADGNCPDAADFIAEAARAFIDAGADVFVGHGPHMLRPVEIYKGKPIFYSLGNFMFMFESVEHLPSEMYERHKLPQESLPSAVHDTWSMDGDGNPAGFHADARFWESVVAEATFAGPELTSVTLRPVVLGLELPRSQRGAARLADAANGERILAGLAEVSRPLGTDLRVERQGEYAVGRVVL